MSSARLALLAALLLGAALSAEPGNPARTPAKPTKQMIARWIAQLGDDDFNAREEATQKLWQAGDQAEPALQEAAKSEDAEISRRARDVLEKFKWGLYPNTPKAVIEIVGRYQTAESNDKRGLVRELLEAGSPGCKALVKIPRVEENQEDRKLVLNTLVTEMPRAVQRLLADDDQATLEALLALGLESDNKEALTNAAAWWLFQGQLDQKIKEYEAKPKSKESAEFLAYLCRAKGNLPAACQVARQAERDDLLRGLLMEAGDWKELARLPANFKERWEEIEQLGYRAAYQRLAGNTKEFEAALAEIHKFADNGNKDPDRDHLLLYAAKALFLNQRPKDAQELLSQSNAQLPALFETLAAQHRYRETLALVEKAKAALNNAAGDAARLEARTNLARVEVLQARTLFGLGHQEQARAIFARLAGEIKGEGEQLNPNLESSWYDSLIEAEFRVGLTEEVFDHAARLLTQSDKQGWSERLLGKLFPSKSETAQALWSAFKWLFPQDDARANLKRLREALAGKVAPKELARWIQLAETTPVAATEAGSRWLALAEAALLSKQEDQARACLEKGGSYECLLKLGDLLAGKKEWEQAARRYHQTWEKDPSQALALYLSGKALVQVGDDKGGQLRMERAHWLPLGSESARHDFCDGLGKRGETAAHRRETELLFRLSQPGSYNSGDAMRRMALEAYQNKDLARSADYQERAALRVLRTSAYFLAQSAYVGVPAMICRQRASALLQAGKVDEALPLIAQCRDMLPGNVDLAIQVVPELEKLGRKGQADELFAKTIGVYEELCKEFPKCAWTHNSIAWTAACCRRDLDRALEHAQKAVELTPKNAGHLDTLSEVYFQRGDKAKAIEIEKKVIELEPNRPYFRKQLKRLEAGDPKAPLPPEAEDEED